MKMGRYDGRIAAAMRPVRITTEYLKHPDGSVLIEMGDTKVICTAMVEDRVPPFLRDTGKGWVTAEYNMLPGSTITRKRRDRDKLDGRSQEIQRLIGRSLRSIIDLTKLGEHTIRIDCDVIQADGGTRTASITGGFVALYIALQKMVKEQKIKTIPVTRFMAAVSVGIVDNCAIADLCYHEDSKAQVDMNLVMDDCGSFIEVQGTGEDAPFTMIQLQEMLQLGTDGIALLIAEQKAALKL